MKMENKFDDFMAFYLDKSEKHRPIMDCLSECCGASCNSDIPMCSECGEHCDIYYEDDEE